jgi:hypothetical protein
VNRRTNTTAQPPKMVSCHADIIAGPETAARLGVPVGTVIGTRDARWYRNPLRQLLWQLSHPRAGRISNAKGA